MRDHRTTKRWTPARVLVTILLVLGDFQWASLLDRPWPSFGLGVDGLEIVAYNQQVITELFQNGSTGTNVSLNVAVQCLSGESGFFTTLDGTVLEDVLVKCTSTQVVFGVILAKWVSFKVDTYKISAYEVCR